MGTKNEPGRFDCYTKLAPDEPYFILRAMDAEAADLVELWDMRASMSGLCPLDKINEAKQVADSMRRWPVHKPPD